MTGRGSCEGSLSRRGQKGTGVAGRAGGGVESTGRDTEQTEQATGWVSPAAPCCPVRSEWPQEGLGGDGSVVAGDLSRGQRTARAVNPGGAANRNHPEMPPRTATSCALLTGAATGEIAWSPLVEPPVTLASVPGACPQERKAGPHTHPYTPLSRCTKRGSDLSVH